jgi:hypothetical protein
VILRRFWKVLEAEVGQVVSGNTYNFVKALIKRSLFLDKENGHNNKNGRRTWTQIHINTTQMPTVPLTRGISYKL